MSCRRRATGAGRPGSRLECVPRSSAGRVARGGARSVDGGDESVWVVRRLDLSIVTRTEAAADEIASSIVSSLGRALAVALTGDGDGTNAIRFRNRAAYLSRFIADVAGGTAWTRWYYAPFAGWRLLPASAAIRSATWRTRGRARGASSARRSRNRDRARLPDARGRASRPERRGAGVQRRRGITGRDGPIADIQVSKPGFTPPSADGASPAYGSCSRTRNRYATRPCRGRQRANGLRRTGRAVSRRRRSPWAAWTSGWPGPLVTCVQEPS